MSTNASAPLQRDRARGPVTSASASVHPVVRTRTAMAAALSAVAVAVGGVIGLAMGGTAFGLYAFALPVPLCLVWLSADVLRADERDNRRT